MPGLSLGDTIPNVQADSTHGHIKLYDYIGDSWAIIFSHPADFTPADFTPVCTSKLGRTDFWVSRFYTRLGRIVVIYMFLSNLCLFWVSRFYTTLYYRSGKDSDFTPVCTTELGRIANYIGEFEKRGVKLLGLSSDEVDSHRAWLPDVEACTPGCKVTYPILADPKSEIMAKLNMLDPDEKDEIGKPLASRALHIIGPDKKLKLSFLYPGTTGRNFDEVLRVVDSLQLAAKYRVCTPANWKPGERVIIPPSVNDEEAKKLYPQGFETISLPSGKKYIRMTKV